MMFLFLIFSTLFTFANPSFNLDDVIVECKKSVPCDQRITRFKGLIGEYRSVVHLKDTLRVMASDGGYQSFTFRLEEIDGKHSLYIQFKLKPIINEVKLEFSDSRFSMDSVQLLSLREGEFFEIQKLNESLSGLKERLETLGYPKNTHEFVVVEKKDKVNVSIKVELGPPRIFKNITTNSQSSFIKKYLKRKFLNLYKKPFDLNSFKIYLDEAQKELFSYGYFLINLEFTPVYKKNRVVPFIKVTNEHIYAFDFQKLKRQHRDEVHRMVVELFRKYKRPLSEGTLTSALRDFYRSKAFLDSKVMVQISETRNSSGEKVFLYRIYFDENEKTRLVDVRFSGNSYFSNLNLEKMFEREAFELASVNYYDNEYFTYFQEYLKNKYIEKGFVQARVFDPAININKEKGTAKIEYSIQEGQRAFLRRIQFSGVPEDIEPIILNGLFNQVGEPFNPIKMADDIKKVASTLQERGFYYAEVINSNDSDLVKYNKAGTNADIFFKVDTGPLVRLNRVLYLGNDKTNKKVLSKKVLLEKGDLITPNITQEIESAISATGLFNTVSVTPLKHNSKNAATDLLVKVSERDYGLLEIAPGYRTDIGLKLTGTVTYQNIGGYNRSVSLRSQLNRRTSYTTIDPQRRNNIEHILEHNTSISYTQGDLFDTLIDGAATAAYQTRRFYSFDANIFRVNGTLTRDFTKRVSTSIRYQYEDITQYSATEEINNGSFQIGSLTPSLTYDLRNNQINATKGAFFNLSCEFANPYLLSQKESDLTIDYYKLVSRNRFYVPFKNGTLAISLVGGVQQNLARDRITVNGVGQTAGYIPTIKVFRLTGMDIIRGYTDEEMNRLPDGKDISDVRITDKAYIANFKFEPRYFINDALMAGVFYDAGRVFADRMDLGELRDSAGLTFKIVTPVGTLDFDYGIKLLRKKDASGRLEDPGRFHVSIGFF